jgi:DNA modification methylase
MSYLITMGSRDGDLVLDPYCGSGTTLEAANMLKRRFIGCELDAQYKDLIEARAYMRTKTMNAGCLKTKLDSTIVIKSSTIR